LAEAALRHYRLWWLKKTVRSNAAAFFARLI